MIVQPPLSCSDTRGASIDHSSSRHPFPLTTPILDDHLSLVSTLTFPKLLVHEFSSPLGAIRLISDVHSLSASPTTSNSLMSDVQSSGRPSHRTSALLTDQSSAPFPSHCSSAMSTDQLF